MKKLMILLSLITSCAFAEIDLATKESRYCGPPPRNEAGYIVRRSDVTYAFKKLHPCPATQLTTGACYGWAIDHIIPLACGGCDSVSNMQWLPVELKSAAGTLPKDRWERSVYANKYSYDSSSCIAKIVIK